MLKYGTCGKKMDIDLDKMKTTNAKENKDEDSQESENEDSEAEEDENLEEAQKDHDRRADITMGSTSTCVQFMNPDEVAFSIAPGQDAIPKFILMDNDFCCDMGQNDTIGKVELNPLSSCQVIILIARMTFNCSTSCLMS